MFALRCAAVRAFAQPSKQLATIRAPSRIVSQISKPTLQRSFFQSRWLAEERRVGAVEGVSPTEPPSAEEMSQVKEESVASSEVTGGVQGALRDAAATVSDALAKATSSGPRNPMFADGSKTVYVGNLSFDARDPDLESEFSKYGNVVSARCIVDSRTGQQRGFAFVEFATVEEANKAIEGANDVSLLGRRMSVQMHVPRERGARRGDGQFQARRPRESVEVSKTLFIGNLSYQMSDKDLNDLFREVSNVRDIRVAIDRRSGQPRGFAHADFFDEASATAAKKILEQKSVYGRPLRVDFSENTATRRTDRE